MFETGMFLADRDIAYNTQTVDTYTDGAGTSVASSAISTDGNYAAFSATGSIRIYVRTGFVWNLQQDITTTGNSYAIALNGDGSYLVIGTNNIGTNNSGVVKVYTRSGSTWSLQYTITSPVTSSPSVQFGTRVDIDYLGETIIVGAPFVDSIPTTDTDTGAGYVYTRSGSSWSLEETLQGSTVQAFHIGGTGVSISNDGNRVVLSSEGGIMIHTRSGGVWTQRATLTDIGYGAQVRDVAISGDGTTIVASFYDTAPVLNGLVVYVSTNGVTWPNVTAFASQEIASIDCDTTGEYFVASYSFGVGYARVYQQDGNILQSLDIPARTQVSYRTVGMSGDSKIVTTSYTNPFPSADNNSISAKVAI